MAEYKKTFYDPTPKRIERIYKKTVDDILDLMVSELSVDNAGSIEMVNQAAIMRQVQFELYKYNPAIRAEVEKAIKKSFRSGQLHLMLCVGEAKSLQEARRGVSFSLIQKGKMEAIAQDTFSDLLVATGNTDVRLKRIIRQSAADSLQLGIAETHGWKQMSNELTGKLTKQGLSKVITEDGFVGVVDKAGRRWKLETYADTVVETKIKDAFVEGCRSEGLETGVDLAVISGHGAKDSCGQWEDVIISMNGLTEGFPTYDDAVGSGQVFHPRCQHHIMPYRSLDLIHPDIVESHYKKIENLEF